MDDVEGPLDPRIQIELENLNSSTDDINKLEIELDEANTAFKQLLSESTSQLKEIMNKIGPGCIEKARCYYEAMEVARQAQVQCQHQAHLFQRASEIHAAAKETVALAEARFISHRHEWNFDQAWQEMLNHATLKVTDAENQKAECAREHHRRAMLFHDAEQKAQQLEEKHHRAIIKAKPYFEIRAHCQQKMATLKERIECRQKAVKEAKRAYAESFRALEEISNQIHQSRRDYDMMVNGPREPGVGAELISPDESLNYEAELNKVSVSRVNSLASSEPDSDDRDQDFKDVLELKNRMENIGSRSADGSESTSSQWELELQASMEKLNILSQKHPNWNSMEKKSSNLSTQDTKNNNQQINFTVPEPHSTQINHDQLNKLPMDFKILKKISNIETTSSNQCQSLTQSPINSILYRSKMALKNSLSRSLSNSPVKIGFNFDKIKGENSENLPKSLPKVSNSNQLSPIDITKPINLSQNSIDRSSEVSMNNYNQNELIKDNNQPRDSVLSESQFKKNDNEYYSASVRTSPINTKILSHNSGDNDHKLNDRFVESPIFKKTSCKISSVKELPLLSMFEKSNGLQQMSKDKSCSLINLAEKQNLKSLLDNSKLGNIQAVSIERLANARHILMGDKSNK